MTHAAPSSWRSLLFVPATRPDRFSKALASGADAVCVDLEDAVAPGEKDAARAAAMSFLSAKERGPDRVVRINSIRTLDGLRDILALNEVGLRSGLVAVPKVGSAEEVDLLLDHVPEGLDIVAQIETLQGVRNATAIAAASPRVCAIMFGGLDLAGELGVPPGWDALLQARLAVAYAAAEAKLPALDMPFPDVSNLEECGAEAARAQALGFSAKMAIHPTQLPAIHDAFTPSADDVAWAERLLESFRRAGGGVALLDGKMIERPVVRNAERLLSRARRNPSPVDGD